MKKTNGKDDEKGSGRNDRIKRDGVTVRRQSWPWKVCAALDSCGTDQARPWFTGKGVFNQVMKWHDLNASDMPENLQQVLRGLIKSGHIERAHKPVKMKARYSVNAEYIYRRTAKPFKQAQMLGDTEKALRIKFDYPRHDKWFRDMMQFE